nr:MAG TPA: hypothetical protein [Caudoviricetes sp.]
MAGQLHGNLPLAIFRGLERKSAGRQGIFQAHSHHTAVRPVSYPPDILEIGLQQIPAWSNFCGIGGTNVRRAKRQLNRGRGDPKGCERHLAVPPVQMFQFLRVVGAVVHVLAQVGVGGNAGNLDAASGGAHNVCVLRDHRVGWIKARKNNTRVHLKFLKCVLRDFRKFTHLVSFQLNVRYSAVMLMYRRLMAGSFS